MTTRVNLFYNRTMAKAVSRRKKRVLVTAGPTRAYLDSVRYLSNVSSGELGFEICRSLKKDGHEVLAVVGPSCFDFESLKLRKLIRVETNTEMRKEVLSVCQKQAPEFGIFSAAVLDFVPVKVRGRKVSSKSTSWKVKLVPAPKIIVDVRRKFPKIKQITFKLQNRMPQKEAIEFAKKRLSNSGAEAIVMNFVEDIRTGTHPAILVDKSNRVCPIAGKRQIANEICKLVR